MSPSLRFSARLPATARLRRAVHAAVPDLKAVRSALDAGADLESRGADGMTSLLHAARIGYGLLLRLLIARGADVRATDAEGRTALMWVVERRCHALSKMLIASGCPLDASDRHGRTALAHAMARRDLKGVALLLEAGADAGLADHGGRLALEAWGGAGALEDLDAELARPARVAARARLLQGLDAERRRLLPRCDAAAAGEAPRRVAADRLREQLNAETVDWTVALDAVAEGAGLETRSTRMWRGRWRQTILARAVCSGRESEARALLARGADVNAVDLDGMTPLMEASWNGRAELARVLLGHGADVNLRNRRGRTALSYAVWSGRSDLVRLLIVRGAAVEVRDQDGWSALMYALNSGQVESAAVLLDHHARRGAVDGPGVDPEILGRLDVCLARPEHAAGRRWVLRGLVAERRGTRFPRCCAVAAAEATEATWRRPVARRRRV